MGNWSGRDVAGLLRSVELSFRGSSWLFYWFFIYIGASSAISIIELYHTIGLSGYVVVMRIVYTLVSMGVALYGAYLLRRGVEGIGRYYNNPDLISMARLQFVAWIIVAAIPISYHYYNYVSYITGAVVVIGLILLGLSMRKVSYPALRSGASCFMAPPCPWAQARLITSMPSALVPCLLVL